MILFKEVKILTFGAEFPVSPEFQQVSFTKQYFPFAQELLSRCKNKLLHTPK